MPRTPRPKAPDLRRDVRRAGRDLDPDLAFAVALAAADLPDDVDRGFAGVREPRAGAFPPLPAVLRFLVADPAMPPR
ncbi:hypothetical protein [Amycolatopsis jejuensis]|uniref:hypothetical protein n=1 Tax=Amycolatopsis jejuensis TaxID=330084 RepID=UPI001FE06D99|nr:hypothetical protein [Amycolatopsis jejuensis]